MFIVRDWYNDDEDDDYPYGLKGGEKYFKKTTEPTAEKALEHKMMQKFLHDAFGEVPCFLMPEPGKAVRRRDFVLKGKILMIFLLLDSLYMNLLFNCLEHGWPTF